MKTIAFLLGINLFFSLHAQEKYDTSVFDKLWADPEIENRIQEGIEQNRKGYATLTVVDMEGKKIPEASLEINQISHEFLFGANSFMVNGFKTPEENNLYEESFAKVFNFASVPFYWKDIEPKQGTYLFDKNSPKVYRRPAPDIVVEFCEKYGLKMKGHTLIWCSESASLPEWYPKEDFAFKKALRKRIESIAERYGDQIQYWDVANEAYGRDIEVWMPKDFVYYTFKLCERSFPLENTLIYNEIPEVFLMNNGEKHAYLFRHKNEYSQLYLHIKSLLERGAKVDMIGLQFHLFNHIAKVEDVFKGKGFTPQTVFQVLDTYGSLGLPLNISEITFPSLPEGPQGLENQAKLTRNFYRLFFSHPNMEAITWWNVPDGYAYQGEDKYKAGCLNHDLTPKPSFHVLDELINKEWRTNLQLKSDIDAQAKFKGFFGKYKITVSYKGKKYEQIIDFTKKGTHSFKIRLN